MASRIKGLTIELDGNATGLDKALKSVNSTIKSTQQQLRDVDKLLKLDPKNTELLAQKQRLLTSEIDATKDKLNTLQQAAKQANDQLAKGQISQQQYDALQREIVETEEKLKGLDKELKETNNSWVNWEKVSEKAGKVAKAAAAAAAAAMAAAGAAVVGIIKQSVEAYSNYEQLVGGVQTLFGLGGQSLQDYAAAQGKAISEVQDEWMALTKGERLVLNNAENAFKTAGMSANQYMETVTSFSASLLQSLGGDTAQAAKVADMAITDMSDNANKMGTDISMIQSAYQGFAKQNYTMLDNLKLGYGGTKTEMERLLKDAEKLSGQKYDISNLDDVYNAIHVIQTEIGITGTTAEEADKTIQGSVSSMKAAYQNLLVSIADKNGDVGTSLDNLINSAKTVMKNLLPVIKTGLKSIATAIKDFAPEVIAMLPGLIDEVLPPLLDAVMEMAVALADTAPALVLTIVNAIVNNLPKLVDTAVKIVQALINGLIPAIPKLIPVALQAVNAIVNGLINNMPLLIRAAGQLIGGLVKGIIQNLPQIASAAWNIIKQIGDLFKPSTAIKWGRDMIQGLIQGLSDNLSLNGIANGARKVASKIASFLHFSVPDEGPLRDYMTWMPDFIQGLTNSLVASEYRLTDAVSGLASDMANEMTANPNAGINSSLASIQGLLSRGNVIVLDTGELVGATAKAYNAEFGKIARLEAAT